MQQVGRKVDKQFGIVRGDEFQPLASVQICHVSGCGDLMEGIKPKLLLQARGDRRNRRHPMGLRGLRRGNAGKPSAGPILGLGCG